MRRGATREPDAASASHLAWLLGVFLMLMTPLDVDAAASARQRPPALSPEQGILQVTKAIAKNPKNAKGYLRRAGYYLVLAEQKGREADLRAAADDLAMATTLAPKDPSIHRRYAEVAAQLGEHQLAVSEFTAAIRLSPREADQYLGRGLSYLALRKDRRANTDFKQALKLKPALRERLAAREQQIRLARRTQDAEFRLAQSSWSTGEWGADGPDLGCTGTTPIHLISQCNSTQAREFLP